MGDAHLEYLGFKTEATGRQYTLRVRKPNGEFRDYTLAIALDAFTAHRARYQDAPEICFLKLRRELAASGDGVPAAFLKVSDADLEEYRSSHAPKPPQRRPKPPIAT